MGETAVAYIDHGGSDHVLILVEVVLDRSPLKTERYRFEIPEDYMDRLEKLLGDGRASVTFGLDAKTSDYGNSAGCSVFIKLTCDQSWEKVNETRLVAQELAELFVKEGQQRAQRILDQALGKETPAPEAIAPPPKETKAPSKATEDVDPEPRSQ